MKTVLLAIEGREPHGPVVSFARQFCHKMDVALDIVHVIDPGQELPAVHELQMDKDVPEGERGLAEPGDLHLLTSENPPKAIANYIDTLRNIVLAIYDGRTGEKRKISSGTRAGEAPMGFEGPLAVPLVVMRS